MAEQFTLYRFWSATDELLYVGRTCNFGPRWAKHQSLKGWWVDIARISIEHYPDDQSLDAAEAAAILTENPRYNVRGRDGVNPDRRVHVCEPVMVSVAGDDWGWTVPRCPSCGSMPDGYGESVERGAVRILAV